MTRAMRLIADGVNDAVVPRYTRYSVTPRLSDEADQSSFAPSVRGSAVRLLGVDGAVMSLAASTRTILLDDGTPSPLRMNSMYQPGGAMFAFAGPSMCR